MSRALYRALHGGGVLVLWAVELMEICSPFCWIRGFFLG
uniref:Uncharacterized protein n=1 Tax=Arundo donax TaxID=35708 RepID=A0A0A9FGS6_ARUDO